MKEKWLKVFEYITEYSLYGMIFFIPINKAPIEIFASFAFVGFIGKKILKPDFSFLRSKVNISLLLFMLFSALSLVNSHEFLLKSTRALFSKWFEYIGIFLIVQDCFKSKKQITRALFVLICFSFVVGIDGLVQRFAGTDFIRRRPVVDTSWREFGVYAVRGPFDHYNGFGTYLVVLISLAIGFLARPRISRFLKWFFFILIVILSSCLVLTFSRGAIFALIVAMTVLGLLYFRNKLLPYVVLVITGFMMFSSGGKRKLIFALSEGGDAYRFSMWEAVGRMIKDHPFLGSGLGTFMDHFPKYFNYPFPQYAHNSYLQIWAETGVFSFISFLLFLFFLLFGAITVFRLKNDFLVLGLLCAVIGFLAHSFLDNQFYSLQLSILFWSMAGLLYKSTLLAKEPQQ